MTVHSFPNKPIRNPARELGISDVPMPPRFAARDMQNAYSRFVAAVAVDQSASLMPPEIARQAMADRARHPDCVRFADVEGMQLIDKDDLNKFIHYVTGHPLAWVLSWQLHSFAESIGGFSVDRAQANAAFAEHVRTAAAAFEAGFNREL
ncbi:hypothetical protein [Rhizobium sp. BK176]|uniref:hypothetical protein n=1 Tax=Rhizobium sp. BK176 TaxID=2587071 RepID=UPI0021679F0C|nr:hypothetical protein [Rhizobium sp. BK176]MCS4090097.1 hypothetical protein [Rhizobium sp. BK176]